MRLTIIFTLFLWLGPPLNVFAADKGPQKAFFAYGRVKEAVYAIHTAIPKNKKRNFYLHRWVENPFVIYKLNLRESREMLKVNHTDIEVPLRNDLYDLRIFKIDSSFDVNHIGHESLNLTGGGTLPILKKELEAGYAFALLGPGVDTFILPVFEETGMALQRGQKWKITTLPYLVTPSVADKIFENKLKAQDLSPTIIHSHWRGWEKMNGYECAVIDFTFNVKSEDQFEVDKEEGEFSLKGTSYFSLDLGLPVVNIIDAKGFAIDQNGIKTQLAFHRKEVLISVQPMDDKKQSIKKDKPPTDIKVDLNPPSKTDKQNDKQNDVKEPSPVENKQQPIPTKLSGTKQSPPTTVFKTPTWAYIVIIILIVIISALFITLKFRRNTEKQ